ncbi:hypothetical protein V6O07_06330, partial [Arthrospira platensis SPKY2]
MGDKTVHLHDKRDQPIEIRWVEKPDNDDRFLYVRSQMKAKKEMAMNDHFCERYEEELDHIAQAIHKKGGTKQYAKVMERIGRIKERYPAANKHYQIDVKQEDGIAVQVTWNKKPSSPSAGEGVYFIRTNLEEIDEKAMWDIYNTIREIE